MATHAANFQEDKLALIGATATSAAKSVVTIRNIL